MEPEPLRVVVTLDDEAVERFAEAVAALREAGLQVDQALETIGAVTGAVAPARLDALRAVRGVAGVEPERTARATR